MPDLWVANASPLIVLGKIGRLDLLSSLPQKIVFPEAVCAELLAGPEGDAARLAIQSQMFPQVDTPNTPPELFTWDLGTGETSDLAYALTFPGWTAILDDRAARNCARSFGIQIKGTLAVIILARKRGLIPSAADILHSMQDAGMRLEDEVIRSVLQTVGEEW